MVLVLLEEDIEFSGAEDGFLATVYLQLFIDIGSVPLNGIHGDDQAERDLFIG